MKSLGRLLQEADVKNYKINLSKWIIAEHKTSVFFMLNVQMLANFSGNSGHFKWD